MEAACFEESSGSLNDTFNMPVSTTYDEDDTIGFTRCGAIIGSMTELFWPKRFCPAAPTRTECVGLTGACFMLNVLALMLKSELSASPMPSTSKYFGFCPCRNEFCAFMSPTVRLPLLSVLLSNTTYHGPRLWLKALAPSNIPRISIAPETSHEERSPLKAVAFENIKDMSDTEETSHVETLPLKAVAPSNMRDI